jgi:REP element-mobilizing transposase RayT
MSNMGSTTPNEDSRLRALAYFLTFRTYGTWLHGDARGSTSSRLRQFNGAVHRENRSWRMREEALLEHAPVVFNDEQRRACQEAILETCRYRRWTLRALNVRTNHVHAVLSADRLPDHVMRDLKSYSTRGLRRAGLVDETQRVWAHHGSTRMLYTPEQVQRACVYTVEQQGAKLGYAPEER